MCSQNEILPLELPPQVGFEPTTLRFPLFPEQDTEFKVRFPVAIAELNRSPQFLLDFGGVGRSRAERLGVEADRQVVAGLGLFPCREGRDDLRQAVVGLAENCLLYTSPSPRDRQKSR